jgi:hypothetical protein
MYREFRKIKYGSGISKDHMWISGISKDHMWISSIPKDQMWGMYVSRISEDQM